MAFETLGLYIHLPWCIQKCPYCDFNSHTIRQSLPEAEYLKALLADLKFEANQLKARSINSIFFGGGTPSLFSGKSIATILETVDRYFQLSENVEITLEANPGTAEASNFSAYRQAGINRLSLGLQSLDNRMLKRLGRIHSASESIQALDMARTAGFNNINLDMMFGLPEQQITAGLKDLQTAISLQPEHLSWYQLTLEPNTRFAANPPTLPTDDESHELQIAGIEMLSASDYARYEVSAFAKSGCQCQHNLNYWQFGDYLGIGAGAHGKITHSSPTRIARFKHPKDYMQSAGSQAAYQCSQAILPEELLFEYLLNQLRLVEGFSLKEMYTKTGIKKDELEKALAEPIRQGLISLDDLYCKATDRGYRYLDEILVTCLSANST